MIFERRAYTIEPGHVPAFDQAQIDRGFDLVKSYMDRLVGYFSTRTGTFASNAASKLHVAMVTSGASR